jgi:hypothetical protein
MGEDVKSKTNLAFKRFHHRLASDDETTRKSSERFSVLVNVAEAEEDENVNNQHDMICSSKAKTTPKSQGVINSRAEGDSRQRLPAPPLFHAVKPNQSFYDEFL